MALDSNAWYTIQNFGNDFFLECSGVGTCGTDTLGLAAPAFFQLATLNSNSSYYIRSKAVKNGANGESYCVNINTGVPAVTTCDTQSATWGIGNWNGQDAGDGKFFFNTERGDSQRLFLSNNETYSLLNYAGLTESNKVLMQWGLSSRAAINDQSYSTVPVGILGGAITTNSSGSITTTASSLNATALSPTGMTSSSSPSAQAPSTFTEVITPTVTASATAGSRTSTSSIIPTVASGGAKGPDLGVKTALVLALVLPQILSFWFGMNLVSYSTSSSESEQESTKNKNNTLSTKRKAEESLSQNPKSSPKLPPPLPPAFHSLYATSIRTSTADDPSLHDGRKRQIAHVPGNWPSHVSLEWLPTSSQLNNLDALIARAKSILTRATIEDNLGQREVHLNTFLRSNLSARLPLHISLSAPLVLSTANKDFFRERLVEVIDRARVGVVAVRPRSLDLVPNSERSRWFLVLRLERVDGLRRLLGCCNSVCEEVGLPLLYAQSDGDGDDVGVGVDHGDGIGSSSGTGLGNPPLKSVLDTCSTGGRCGGDTDDSIHISIAWTLEAVAEETRVAIRDLDLAELRQLKIEFDRVKIKVGNVVDDVLL